MNPFAIALVWFAFGAVAMLAFVCLKLARSYRIDEHAHCAQCRARLSQIIVHRRAWIDRYFCSDGCETRYVAAHQDELADCECPDCAAFHAAIGP